MHICLVSREYPPNLMGGIGTYVVNMARILAAAGHTVSVLTQAHPDVPSQGLDAPVLDCAGRLRVYYLPFVDAQWKLLPGVATPEVEALMRRDMIAGFGPVVTAALGELLRREAVDVVEAPEYEAPLLHFQQQRSALPPDHPWRKVPCVVHLHSPSHMIFQHNDDPLTGRWVRARRANEALGIELADGVLSPSAFLAGQVRGWLRLPQDGIHVLPYPIGPLLEFDPSVQPQAGLCLFVGRVEPRKGVFEFVEAAVQAAKRHPHARFRFVGGPHHRDGKSGGTETAELLRSLIPGPLRGRFEFACRVPRAALGAEYRRAAFTAVPSRWDNYPNTCMEAMSCARPVLASDQGGMAEMIEDGVSGILASVRTAASGEGSARAILVRGLVEGLDRMLTLAPERLAAMGEAARGRILSICEDARIIDAHLNYYESLCQQAPRTPRRTGPDEATRAALQFRTQNSEFRVPGKESLSPSVGAPPSSPNAATPSSPNAATPLSPDVATALSSNVEATPSSLHSGLCLRVEAPPPPLPAGGIILLDDRHPTPGLRAALDAVAAQDYEHALRLLAGEALSRRFDAVDRLAGWHVIPSDPEGIEAGAGALPGRLRAAVESSGASFLYIGAADDVLAPPALRGAAHFFNNHPEAGCCTCWTRDGAAVDTFFRNDPLHLLAPTDVPERWFFRVEALLQAGGILVNGSHLPDLLRDAVLRLRAKGWRIGCLAQPLVSARHRVDAPVLRPFAFQERRDSIRAVAEAHLEQVCGDASMLAEMLSEGVGR